MVLLRNYRRLYVKASSLIESVIAVTIITLCLLIALKLYINILDHTASINDSRVKYELNGLVAEMKLNNNFDAKTYNYKNFIIKKVISNYGDQEDLLIINYIIQTKKDTIKYSYLIQNIDEK